LVAGQLLERQALEAVDDSILQFQRTMEEAAKSGALDPEQLDRFLSTLKEAAARVNAQILPQIDSDSSNEISRRLIGILTLDTRQLDPLDAADQYLVDLEAIRHVLRDLLQEQHPRALRREAKEVVALLEDWLPHVSVADKAELVGLSVRQLQRRRHDGGPASPREQLVARLVAVLRNAWTDAGVLAWFSRPRNDLDGSRPIELLDDPQREQDLLVAARAGRVQGGL
jgi:uncharacterized protein (DUF2384 family)